MDINNSILDRIEFCYKILDSLSCIIQVDVLRNWLIVVNSPFYEVILTLVVKEGWGTHKNHVDSFGVGVRDCVQTT